MRLRRSSSTPSDTRPATSRRATVSPRRRTPAARIASPSVVRPALSPSWIWSMARPVSHGMATVMTIATAASSPDQTTPLR